MKQYKKNIKYLNRFEQTHARMIEKLFWIACQLENRELDDMLQDMDNQDYEDLFPELYKSPYFKQARNQKQEKQFLLENDKLGFIAEVHFPVCKNFRFKDDKPIGWSSGGTSRIGYCYGETIDQLMVSVETAGETMFKEFIEEFKATHSSEVG